MTSVDIKKLHAFKLIKKAVFYGNVRLAGENEGNEGG